MKNGFAKLNGTKAPELSQHLPVKPAGAMEARYCSTCGKVLFKFRWVSNNSGKSLELQVNCKRDGCGGHNPIRLETDGTPVDLLYKAEGTE